MIVVENGCEYAQCEYAQCEYTQCEYTQSGYTQSGYTQSGCEWAQCEWAQYAVRVGAVRVARSASGRSASGRSASGRSASGRSASIFNLHFQYTESALNMFLVHSNYIYFSVRSLCILLLNVLIKISEELRILTIILYVLCFFVLMKLYLMLIEKR